MSPSLKGEKALNTTKCCWNKKVVTICMLPAILVYLLLKLLPSFMTFLYSFTDIRRTGGEWHFIGLENYHKLFFIQNTRDTMDAVIRTLVFAFVVTILQNAFALLLAVLFNSKILKGRNLYRSIVFLPYVLGVTVCCYTWVLMTGIDGPIMTLLNKFGISSTLLASPQDAFAWVIFIHVWISIGYTMVLYIAGLQGIPTELYEAAAIDGGGIISNFLNITIPLLWPTITINVLLTIIGSLGNVQTILLTTGGAMYTETLAMRIYRTAFGIGATDTSMTNPTQGFAAAQSMLLFVIILFFTIIMYFMTKRREQKYES